MEVAVPINADVSDLPTGGKSESRPPSRRPILVNRLASLWYERYLASGKADYAKTNPELPYRLSATGSRCDRQLHYELTDTEKSNPPGMADAWRFALGHYVGDAVAALFFDMSDGWFPEWRVDLRAMGIEGSGHADLVHLHCPDCGESSPMVLFLYGSIVGHDAESHPQFDHWAQDDNNEEYAVDADGNVLVECSGCGLDHGGQYLVNYVAEVKSINGFGFKKAATEFKGHIQGPRSGAILQGALAAKALGCEKLIVAYFAMENISPQMAERYASSADEWARFSAEWHFTTKQLAGEIDAEIRRIGRLLKLERAGILPSRELHDPEYPVGAIVVAPKAKGRWQIEVHGVPTNVGTTWMCDYCDHIDTCVKDGEGGQLATVEL